MGGTLDISSSGAVTTVALNRPDVRNAMNADLIRELTEWAASASTDTAIRVVILRGAGAVFSAGADARWMASMAGLTPEANLEDARRTARMFLALDSLPVPVIGRVHGAAIGGGAGLAAICDIVVAADDAIFGFTETTIGLVPALIGPYVVRKIGISAARALCLTGTRFSASRARELGLVHEIASIAALDDAVARHVEQALKTSPSAVAATKRLLRDIAGHRPADVAALTADTIARQRASAEGQEGLRAFLEKRPPEWARPPQ
jgi:methylglutaconyl-CoA hydratase